MRHKGGNIILLLFCGVLAGIINGLIGCGGGIIIVYALSFFYGRGKGGGAYDRRSVFATAVASILPMSAVSSYLYFKNGGAPSANLSVYLVPAVCGGIVGAFLLDKISSKWLGRIFSLLVIWAGVSLILKGSGVM